jgi:hypothetical protein
MTRNYTSHQVGKLSLLEAQKQALDKRAAKLGADALHEAVTTYNGSFASTPWPTRSAGNRIR